MFKNRRTGIPKVRQVNPDLLIVILLRYKEKRTQETIHVYVQYIGDNAIQRVMPTWHSYIYFIWMVEIKKGLCNFEIWAQKGFQNVRRGTPPWTTERKEKGDMQIKYIPNGAHWSKSEKAHLRKKIITEKAHVHVLAARDICNRNCRLIVHLKRWCVIFQLRIPQHFILPAWF